MCWLTGPQVAIRASLVLSVSLLLLPALAAAQNNPPIADAGPDQTIYLGDSVTLNGSATDPDGHAIVGWQWEVVSAPAGSAHNLAAATTPNAVFTADTVGGYGITLSAWDGLAWSQPDATVVWIVENEPPTAVADASPLSGPAPLIVGFDGTGSSDPEGGALWYDWDFGDFTSGTGATPGHEYLSPGTYVARLMVTDDHDNIDFDTIEITVSEPGPIPAVSRWGLAVLALVLVGSGLWRGRVKA
jgi:PKD repeat protein